MKVALVTAFHGRPEVSSVFFEGLRRLKRKTFATVRCFAAVTQGDQANIDLCEANDTPWHPHDNKDLGNKFNLACRLADQWDPDAVIVVGSDDLLSDDHLREVVRLVRDGEHYIFPGSIGMYSPADRRGVVLKGPIANNSVRFGAGRAFSRDMMVLLGWCPWPQTGLRKGLDTASHARCINLCKVSGIAAVMIEDDRHHVLDVKSETNLWGSATQRGDRLSEADATWFLSKPERAALRAIG